MLPPPSAIAAGEPSLVNPRFRFHHPSKWLDERNTTVVTLPLETSPMASYRRSTAVPCLCLTNEWGPLTSGSQLSVTVSLGFLIFFLQKCVQTLENHILSQEYPIWVNQILLCSSCCVVFNKNMKLAMFHNKIIVCYLSCLFLNKLRKCIT